MYRRERRCRDVSPVQSRLFRPQRKTRVLAVRTATFNGTRSQASREGPAAVRGTHQVEKAHALHGESAPESRTKRQNKRVVRVYAQKRRIEPLTRPFSEPFSAHLGSACWFSDTSSLLLSIVSSIGGLSLPRLKWTTVESRIPPLPPTKFRVHGVDTLTRFSKCGRWGRKLLPPSPESNIAVRGMQLCFATTACFATIRLNRLGKYSQGAAR